jgi:hypothetical protein
MLSVTQEAPDKVGTRRQLPNPSAKHLQPQHMDGPTLVINGIVFPTVSRTRG